MSDSHSTMEERGRTDMGFSQTDTTHHFFLSADGGVIQVEANKGTDSDDRASIRMHLAHITKAFQDGDFAIPMFVHDTVPPEVPQMKRLRKHIRYSFEETPNGARVVISSSDHHAIAAIHRFLRFQIAEHNTGDPMDAR
jgi:glycerophosphoryl diester phosphodiesterase